MDAAAGQSISCCGVDSMKTLYIWALALLAAALMTVPKAWGVDDEPLAPDTDAQRSAQRQVAEDQCVALYGAGAMFFETKRGDLVCRDGRLK